MKFWSHAYVSSAEAEALCWYKWRRVKHIWNGNLFVVIFWPGLLAIIYHSLKLGPLGMVWQSKSVTFCNTWQLVQHSGKVLPQFTMRNCIVQVTARCRAQTLLKCVIVQILLTWVNTQTVTGKYVSFWLFQSLTSGSDSSLMGALWQGCDQGVVCPWWYSWPESGISWCKCVWCQWENSRWFPVLTSPLWTVLALCGAA